jgi:hypothetical protein
MKKKVPSGMLISVMIAVVMATSWKRERSHCPRYSPLVIKLAVSFLRKCDQGDDNDDDDANVSLVTTSLKEELL